MSTLCEQDIQLYQQEQEEWRRLVRAQEQILELEECTFTPNIIRDPPPSLTSQPVAVRGLGRYLELRGMAKQKKVSGYSFVLACSRCISPLSCQSLV